MTTVRGVWDFDYGVPPNEGLVLQNVSHATYFFARDIRIAGIWIGYHAPGAAQDELEFLKPFKLNSAELGGIGLEELTPGENISPPPDFPYYRPVQGVKAEFKTSNPIFGSGSELLRVTQEYLFTTYGLDPPHEPGAVLNAARMFPLFKFTITGDSGSVSRPATYLRVDYRFNLTLDAFRFGFGIAQQFMFADRTHNQAGIFRDNEDTPFPLQLTWSTSRATLGFRLADISDVFAAAEKPLQYEICTLGLQHGDSNYAGKPATWDNIHQWPAPYPGGLPSTPGAFHSAHLHWRWGAVAGNPPDLTRGFIVPAAGQGQFKGLGWTSTKGGPLLDRRAPDQNYRFAITKNFNSDLSNEILSAPKFEDLFIAQRGTVPDSFDKDGNDLVIWLSIEVFRDRRKLAQPWEGALFVHGMYFAHNPEPGVSTQAGAQAAAGGLRERLLKPKPDRQWKRFAVK
jgi:hypothetical protein